MPTIGEVKVPGWAVPLAAAGSTALLGVDSGSAAGGAAWPFVAFDALPSG